eukprot:569434-Amphidinium_carterae.1
MSDLAWDTVLLISKTRRQTALTVEMYFEDFDTSSEAVSSTTCLLGGAGWASEWTSSVFPSAEQ